MKYRIIKSYWIGVSGRVYDEYMPQKKGWFFWNNILNSGFDSVEEAEAFLDKHKEYPLIVKEYE